MLSLLLFLPLAMMAQETTKESTVYVDGQKIVVRRSNNKIKVKVYEETIKGDTIENDQIFEGVYLDGQSTERRMVVSIPFVTKKNTKKKSYRFEPHAAGVYIGYSRLYDDKSFSKPGYMDMQLSKSWEIGINLFEGSIPLTRNRHWGITTGLGWGYTSFRLDNHMAINEIDGITGIFITPEAIYDQSRLRYNFFRLPVVLEWQKRVNGYKPFFLSAGAEAEVRYGIKSKVKIDGQSRTIAKDLNAHPLGINLLAQGGYSNIGLYARYATSSLFEKNKGLELYPFSLGIFWHW